MKLTTKRQVHLHSDQLFSFFTYIYILNLYLQVDHPAMWRHTGPAAADMMITEHFVVENSMPLIDAVPFFLISFRYFLSRGCSVVVSTKILLLFYYCDLVRRFSGWSCGEGPLIVLVSRRTEENGQFNPSISTICCIIARFLLVIVSFLAASLVK